MLGKRLSDVKGFEDIGFNVKFTKSEFVDTLRDGDLFMNNFKSFIEIEINTKNKGQGDEFEGAHVIKSNKIKLYDAETDLEIGSAASLVLIERNSAVDYIPLFCYTRFPSKDFVVIDENDEYVSFKIDLPEEEKNSFLSNFGDKAVFLPGDFVQMIEEEANKLELDFIVRPVSYEDYNYYSKKRHKVFEEGSTNILFWKDLFFKSQRECRFVILNNEVKSNMIFHVEGLKENVFVFDAEYFFNGLAVKFSKKLI